MSYEESEEITRSLEQNIYQINNLLTQVENIHDQKNNISTDSGIDALSYVARKALGRTGGKYARKILTGSEKMRIKSLENTIESQHNQIVYNLRGFVGSISEWKNKLSEPNSHRFLAQLEKAQEGIRVLTRVRATHRFLLSLKSKRLIFNKDITAKIKQEIVLPPKSPFTGLVELRKILASVQDYVKICDNWVDIKTLELLLSVPTNIPIKVLTGESGRSKKFVSACKAFQVEHGNIEVRISDTIHDRFILTKNAGWQSGSSLKDFGKKFSAITPIQDEGRRSAEKIFDELWKMSARADQQGINH